MELIKIKFLNYRNLNNLETVLNKDMNFIVGENNIGKSNFQTGVYKVLSGRAFAEDDFAEKEKEIRIDMRFHLSDDEIGIFDDLVDPSNAHCINISALQENANEYIKYLHTETGETIPSSLIRRINVITYDSLRNPKNEIDFNKTKGAGAFLNYIVKKYVSENNDVINMLKRTEVKKIEKYISNALKKMSVFERFDINPFIEVDGVELISRILSLKDDNNIGISNSGYGVQFNILIILSLLEKIIDFKKKKRAEEEEFSALLIFDEPEIHLHPYLQRSIIKDIIKIVNGEDEEFNSLLVDYFGIKKISAQIIVTTHSPNMLDDDYNYLIRMYRKAGETKAVSCADLVIQDRERKQLLMQFEYIKEAVFSRAAIIVEGESEYGSFKEFGHKLDIDFDNKGIALIKAGGADSILSIISLLNKIGIKSVGVIDKDKQIERKLPKNRDDLFYTKTKCFDSEIVRRLLDTNNIDVLKNILSSYDSAGENRSIHQNKLNTVITKYGFKGVHADATYKFKDITVDDDLFEIMYVAWFDINKGILLGKTIGQFLSKNDIPTCYKKAIRKVAKYADEYIG